MQRHSRLEQDVKLALSHIISYEVKEPLVSGLICVTEVNITPDQKYAKVYVSIFGKKNKEKVITALRKATGFIKFKLGKMVKLRNIPELIFEIDNSMEYGDHMNKVINKVIENDNKNHSISEGE